MNSNKKSNFSKISQKLFWEILKNDPTLKNNNISQSWNSLRDVLSVQRRITASFATQDGATVNIRKATTPDHELRNIYTALDINNNPGGIKKIVT
jgi:hypothetical protein